MISIGRAITGSFDLASAREWLVTNGLGGWASGTVSGANTRRYHGIFVPALQPPLGRTLLVSKLNEWATLDGQQYALSSNEYADGTVDPHGYRHIESFRLDGLIPTWTFALADALLEKRIWMIDGQDTTMVTYTLRRGSRSITLDVIPMVTRRDAHAETSGAGWSPAVAPGPNRAAVTIDDLTFHLRAAPAAFEAIGQWHWGLHHRVETERGLPDREDQFAVGRFTGSLAPGETMALACSLDPNASLDWEPALAAERRRQAALIEHAGAHTQPEWIQQLVLAADQFIVKRGSGKTVIAGYHWFGDWGRDTMIALPGLTLATKRFAVAADILRTFSKFVSQGMLPNRFPDAGERPEYNTVDATLWYFHALDRYLEAGGDVTLARELWPVLEDIVDWHVRGTRYQIHMDPADGLIYAGEPGVQLTWMDARVEDWVVTPRIGKPVEINALWVNALRVLDGLSRRLNAQPKQNYAALADRAARSFEKYWYAAGGHLYDVIDGPGGADPSLRPNQLFAVSLPHGPLAEAEQRDRARAVVEACARHLATSAGLRSLSPTHPDYKGLFTGDRWQRDGAYHQGTVWSWLIGPFVEAHFRVLGDAGAARSFLAPFEQHLADSGLGSIAEVFDGEPPHAPRGCIAQAWSVAEVLRMWNQIV